MRSSHRDCLSGYSIVSLKEAFKTSGVGVVHFSVSLLNIVFMTWFKCFRRGFDSTYCSFTSRKRQETESYRSRRYKTKIQNMTIRLWIKSDH